MTEPPIRRIAQRIAQRTARPMRAGLVAVICLVVMSASALAQTIPARGGLHEDFGRLVIDFPGAVATEISGDGQRLELRFDRAARIDLGEAASTLKNYLAKASLSPDNRRLTLDFTAPVTWQAFNDGAKLALDFAFAEDAGQREFDHGPDAATSRIRTAGAATPVPAAAAEAAAPAAVRLRSGEHQGFSRLAFDWPKDVTYTIRQNGDQAELRFSTPGAIDLNKIAGDLPPRLNAISATPEANGTTVKLALKPGTVLRDFRSGNTVVLDVYDRNAANLPPERSAVALAEQAAPPAPAQPAMQSSAPVAEQELQPVEPEVPLAPAKPQATPAQAQLAPVQAEPAPPAPAPTPAPVQQAAAPAPPMPQLQSAMPEAPPVKPATTAGATGPGVATPVTAQATTAFEPPRVAPPAVNVKISALKQKDGAELFFDWPKPVALAVFRQGDALWLVFDAPAKTDLKPLASVEPLIGKVTPFATPFALALRLTGGTAASPKTETQGARWKITLNPGQTAAPVQAMEQRRETLPDGSNSLFVKAIASGAAIDLQDPADRSKLVVTPSQIPGLGMARQSDWPDFKLLPSHQGVVVSLLNDRPKVQASPNGVVIVTPPQAAAEAKTEEAAPAAAAEHQTEPAQQAGAAHGATEQGEGPPPPEVVSVPKALTVTGSLFDMKKWRRGGEAKFLEDDKALRTRIEQAAPGDRNRAKLDYAQYLLANGFFPEAAGRISEITDSDRSASGNPLIMAIGAAAETMGGAFDRANRLLAMPALQGVPEADLMRAYIAAKRGDSATAAKLFSGPLPNTSDYPKAFRNDARKMAARALLETGDPLTAQNYIDPLRREKDDPDAAAWAAYLDALRQQKMGQKEPALAALEKLGDSPIPEIRARAQFAVVTEQLDEKKITPEDAVKKLEALRFLWRGDTFEFDLLTALGHLYFDVAQPRKGLLTLRQAATHFPDHPKAKLAADDMTGEFRKLYLGGGADRLSPLTAVALYDEFRELTPPGPDGNRMIAALADRLVKVELLDRAADLLDRQVKTRLSGADKVAAGTRLAAVRLLDNKPDPALQALGESEDAAATSPEIQAQRQRLRARALFATGDTLKGLALVANDDSLKGLWLKADMYWKLNEWPAAADALGKLIDAEQAKRKAAQTGPAPGDIAANPASVLDKALADAKAAAAASGDQPPADPNAPAGDAAAQTPAQKPLLDPVLSRLILNRAVALSLANDRRGMKDLGRQFGKEMDTTPLAQPFKVLTSPESGFSESYDAQLKSVDQIGVFVEEYRKILQAEALGEGTDDATETGPLAPLDKPADTSGSTTPSAPAPAEPGHEQTASQPSPQAAGQ